MAQEALLPEIPKELLDRFVTGPMSAPAIEVAMRKFEEAVIERAFAAEVSRLSGPWAWDEEAGRSHQSHNV
jgi:hypothetical protein